jgi:hypothetical protein
MRVDADADATAVRGPAMAAITRTRTFRADVGFFFVDSYNSSSGVVYMIEGRRQKRNEK